MWHGRECESTSYTEAELDMSDGKLRYNFNFDHISEMDGVYSESFSNILLF